MITFWIVAGLLCIPMVLFGGMKVVKSRDELRTFGMLWVDDYSARQVQLIGVAEVLGAIGVIVPTATGILPVLAPIAAACLGVLMLGAFFVHLKRKDPVPALVITAVLTACAGVVVGLAATA